MAFGYVIDEQGRTCLVVENVIEVGDDFIIGKGHKASGISGKIVVTQEKLEIDEPLSPFPADVVDIKEQYIKTNTVESRLNDIELALAESFRM